MARNYLNNDIDHFNSTRRLNNKPKLFIGVVVFILMGLLLYIIFAAKQDINTNNDGIEVKESRLDNDEYVKNMADNKGYLKKQKAFEENSSVSSDSTPLENLSEEDYNEIFKSASPTTSTTSNDKESINHDIINMIDNNSKIQTSYPPIPISTLDNLSISDVDSTIQSQYIDDEVKTVNLTAEQITMYNQHRYTELEAALKSPTGVYKNNISDENKTVSKSSVETASLTYEEQLNKILEKTGNYNNKTPEKENESLLNGEYDLGKKVQKARKGEIKTGTVIPGILITEINSSVAGTVIGQVRQNVYDTATGNDLLIPQGAKLIGEYASDVPYGNKRLFMSWKRIVFPNGDSLDLDVMPGADMTGRAGFEDKVNTHFWKIFGNSILFSLIIGGINITTSDNLFNFLLPVYARDITGSMGDALAVSLGETMSEMIKKNINIAPEITIRSGYLFNIMVTKDIVLPPYKQ